MISAEEAGALRFLLAESELFEIEAEGLWDMAELVVVLDIIWPKMSRGGQRARTAPAGF
jgi:hypothetical protein